jgi:hypothetical protein
MPNSKALYLFELWPRGVVPVAWFHRDGGFRPPKESFEQSQFACESVQIAIKTLNSLANPEAVAMVLISIQSRPCRIDPG